MPWVSDVGPRDRVSFLYYISVWVFPIRELHGVRVRLIVVGGGVVRDRGVGSALVRAHVGGCLGGRVDVGREWAAVFPPNLEGALG